MGKVLDLETYRKARPADQKRKNTARSLIYEAASLLSEAEEPDRRIKWLLEDCAGLLDAPVQDEIRIPGVEELDFT